MRRVLVIRLSSLGDVVLTAPVFHALRQAWPDAQITALTKESFGDVLLGNPNIDQTHVAEERRIAVFSDPPGAPRAFRCRDRSAFQSAFARW